MTPTQQRMLAVFRENRGTANRTQLQACLNDELSGRTCLNSHLTILRRKLAPHFDIVYADGTWKFVNKN